LFRAIHEETLFVLTSVDMVVLHAQPLTAAPDSTDRLS